MLALHVLVPIGIKKIKNKKIKNKKAGPGLEELLPLKRVLGWKNFYRYSLWTMMIDSPSRSLAIALVPVHAG